MPINPKSWAEGFTAQLIVGGEHVPLDRVVARHADAFAELRGLGMTWRGIAQVTARVYTRRADGSVISSDQLRVGYARLSQKKANRRPEQPRRSRSARTADRAPPLATTVPLPPPPRGIDPPGREASDAQDVSGNEIEAALARLSKM